MLLNVFEIQKKNTKMVKNNAKIYQKKLIYFNF